MKKLFNVKAFTFYIEVDKKEEIDKYLQDKPFGFSAFVRMIIEKETTKYMPNAGLEKKKYKRVNDRLDIDKKYKMVSANIEEIDLRVLEYIANLKHISIGALVRNLLNNEMIKLV